MYFDNAPSLEEVIRADKLSRVELWPSRFGFLKAHYGVRPGRVSYLLGTTGTGKTSLFKSVISDSLAVASAVVLSTEENALRYMPDIDKAGKRGLLDRVNFVYEKNISPLITKSQKNYLAWIEDMLVSSGVKIMFFDNLTTSALYAGSGGVAGQEDAVNKLSEMAQRLDVAIFIAMHTRKEITDNMGRMISGEDVRGTAQSFISADFFYVFQRWAIGEKFFPFIQTVKHRGYSTLNKSHLLEFSNGVYTSDSATDFEKINAIFNMRNQLGRINKK
jgi:hypothetical protein